MPYFYLAVRCALMPSKKEKYKKTDGFVAAKRKEWNVPTEP